MAQQDKQIGLSLSSACQLRQPVKTFDYKKKMLNDWTNRSPYLSKFLAKIESQIHDAQESGNQQFLDEIKAFVDRGTSSSFGYLPTAVVKLGMNVADNEVVFDLIQSKLQQKKSTFTIVQLSPQDLLSYSSVLSSLTQQLLTKDITNKLFKDSKMKRTFFNTLTYADLMTIYHNYKKTDKPIVIMIPQLHASSSHAGLKSLIPVMQKNLETFPVLLICGTFTKAITIENVLPAKVVDCLLVDTFVIGEAKQMFEKVIEKALITSDFDTLHLGPKMINLIVENFLFHDYSLKTVNLLLRVAIFAHNSASRLSTIISSDLDRLDEELGKMKSQEIEKIVTEVNSLPSLKNIKIPNNLKTLKEVFKTTLTKLKTTYSSFMKSVIYLHGMNKSLPEKPLGTAFSEIFDHASKGNLLSLPECDRMFKIMKFLSIDELKSMIETCLDITERSDHEFCVLFENHSKKIEKLEKQNDEAEPQPRGPQIDLSTCKTRAEWQNKLRESIAARPLTPFEQWRLSFIADIKNVLANIKAPYHLPLHEVIFYDNVQILRTRCFPSPRDEMLTLFKSPLTQLPIKDVHAHHTLDMTTIYNQLLFNSASINLADFLDAYKCQGESSRTSPAKKRKTKGKNNEADDQRFVRFYNMMEDLEYTGIVMKNNRKQDHIIKLVWE